MSVLRSYGWIICSTQVEVAHHEAQRNHIETLDQALIEVIAFVSTLDNITTKVQNKCQHV